MTTREEKERLLYLRKLATGELQGPLTGYPSIDKPWLKWHKEENIIKDYRNTNVCDYFFNMVDDEVFIEYYGKKYYKKDMKKIVNDYICKFANMGIREDDSVTLIMLDVPEILFMWLALAKMGATANVIKFDEGADRIKQMSNDIGKSDYMFISEVPFIVDNVVGSLEKGNNVKKVITVPITSDLSIVNQAKMLYKTGTKGKENTKEKIDGLKELIDSLKESNEKMSDLYKKDKRFISFNEFNRKYHARPGDTKIPTVKDAMDKVSMIVYTGGTTGDSKGCELTNENIIASTHTLKYSEVGFDKGKSSLNILPPGPSYWIHAVYGLLCCGVSVNMISNFTLDEYPSLIKDYKPNIFLSGPILLKGIVDQDIFKDDDCSFITGPMSGGDKLHLSEEERFNNYIQSKNSKAYVMQGYGESESCGAASVCKQNAYKIGSVGEPLIGIDVAVFEYVDYDEFLEHGVKEKKYNEVGELCISGPTLMKGYRNNIDATNKVIRMHEDGKLWLHTDDLGYIDEDGRIFHCGRAKRMLTRSGAKVWLSALEDIIKQHSNVFDCCCVKLDDETEREVPVCHIVLNDYSKAKETIKEIEEMIKNSQPLTYIPKFFIIKEEIPVTKVNNKVDFKSLESEDILNTDNYDINQNMIEPKKLKLEK